MPSITIRDVPPDARDELAARARRNGQSLQEFLKALLVRTAAAPDLEEWVREARELARSAGLRLSAEEVVALVHAGRDDDGRE
ncbi:FitA-like ribbon-helix-helix domain-containing protein [Aquipuribacter nitratireducens]|uniref:Antitoxin FitA-like ribbon-helix-helix domain-containing protein n=1 Tax=Aquipuribacter nitratireducens TaxID=650104 RepID=A0ABW0GQ79_9MICO